MIILLLVTLSQSPVANAVRPFVTDDARITDERQIEIETWTEFGRSSHDTTLGQHFMGGYSPTHWLQVIGGLGIGQDLERGNGTVSNAVIQPKFLLWQAYDDGFPGFAVSTGYIFHNGHGAYHDEAQGSYAIGMLTTRLFDDWLQVHLNFGRLFGREAGGSWESRNYWGLGLDLGVFHKDYRLIAEAYAGDPFEPLGPELAFQAGLRWLKSDFVNFDFTAGTQPEQRESGTRSGRWEYWAQAGVRVLFDTLRGSLGPGSYEGARGAFNPRGASHAGARPQFN
jgi:hypothetical protein